MRRIGRRTWRTLTLSVVVEDMSSDKFRVDAFGLHYTDHQHALAPFLIMAIGKQQLGDVREDGWREVTRPITVARIGRKGRHRLPFQVVPAYVHPETGHSVSIELGSAP